MVSSVIIALIVFGMDFVFEVLMKQAYDIIK
jgi:preprotein translocase subunit SecE